MLSPGVISRPCILAILIVNCVVIRIMFDLSATLLNLMVALTGRQYPIYRIFITLYLRHVSVGTVSQLNQMSLDWIVVELPRALGP